MVISGMMRIFGIAAVAAIGLVGAAAPAVAEPDVTGEYNVLNTLEMWAVTSCGDGCIDINSTTGPNRHLHHNGSQWVSMPYVGSVHCPLDNSNAAAEMTMTVNEGFTGYAEHTIRVIGTCENGYSFLGENPDTGGSLVKQS